MALQPQARTMKASQRYRLRRLAAELSGERGTWLAEDPPTWDWTRAQRVHDLVQRARAGDQAAWREIDRLITDAVIEACRQQGLTARPKAERL